MRKILFKARRKNWKELPQNEWWVEGFYISAEILSEIKHYILPIGIFSDEAIDKRTIEFAGQIEIDIETLCQYTGLTDKNGKMIWEWDIIKTEENIFVKWDENSAGWCLAKNGWMFNHFFNESVKPEECEVIGNLFDNPQLLKV